MSTSKQVIFSLIFILMLAGLIFFGWEAISLKAQLLAAEKTISQQEVNTRVLAFSKLFVANVLQGGQTVSFDQRLQLENAVRDINDEEIYAAWKKFTNASGQAEVQQDFYGLFNLLLAKLSVQN